MGSPHFAHNPCCLQPAGCFVHLGTSLGRFTREQSTQWPFGVIVCLALCGSHMGRRILSHVCFCPAVPSQGCPFIFLVWHIFCLPFFPFSFLYSSFFSKPVFLMVFFADMMFLFLSFLAQQLLSLSLLSVSCLLCVSSIFLILSRFSSTSCKGLCKISSCLFSFENLSFSIFGIILALFFSHSCLTILLCNLCFVTKLPIIWGVCV